MTSPEKVCCGQFARYTSQAVLYDSADSGKGMRIIKYWLLCSCDRYRLHRNQATGMIRLQARVIASFFLSSRRMFRGPIKDKRSTPDMVIHCMAEVVFEA